MYGRIFHATLMGAEGVAIEQSDAPLHLGFGSHVQWQSVEVDCVTISEFDFSAALISTSQVERQAGVVENHVAMAICHRLGFALLSGRTSMGSLPTLA
jgi:hypothetical protein